MKCDSSHTFDKEAFLFKCWMEGTFVFRSCLNGIIEKNVMNYGVGNQDYCMKNSFGEDYKISMSRTDVKNLEFEDRIYQKHYQWVIPVLALQALLFYIPRAIWQNMESGLMGKLLKNTGKFGVKLLRI